MSTHERTEAAKAARARALAEYVTRVVDEAPPLSPEQRDRIAVILRAAADEARAREGAYPTRAEVRRERKGQA